LIFYPSDLVLCLSDIPRFFHVFFNHVSDEVRDSGLVFIWNPAV
jgi:hypothetical protein